MEGLHSIETGLANIVSIGQLCLESISVFCVLFGVVKTVQLLIQLNHQYGDRLPFDVIRVRFGVWLALALEFQLGADILATTVTPTNAALIRLAAIALIRTFLNYFLNKELEEQIKQRKLSDTV
jgi:uncharacterized membrane protein